MYGCLKTWSQSQTVFERHWHKGHEQINEDSNIDCIQSTVHISALHGSFKNSCFLSKFLISSLFTQKKYNFSLYKDTYGQSTITMKRKMLVVVWFFKLWHFCFDFPNNGISYYGKRKNAVLCFWQFQCFMTFFTKTKWNEAVQGAHWLEKHKWSALWGHTVKQIKCTKYQSLISFPWWCIYKQGVFTYFVTT